MTISEQQSGVVMSEHRNALLGYVRSEPKKDEQDRLIGFSTRAAKWQYMKDCGLSEVYLQIKAVFGDIGEPVITQLGNKS